MGGRGSSSKLQRNYDSLFSGRQYYQSQNFDVDTRLSLMDYTDADPTPGSLYNASQNMNYAILTGQQLDPQQQFMYDSIINGMHQVGQDVTLTRYDHGDALDRILQSTTGRASITHDNMTVQQLKSLLVGHSYTDPRILSTSYNNFMHAADPSTFTTREIKFTYRTTSTASGLMPPMGNGGNLGEFLLGPSNNYKIVDVKLTGAGARPKGGSKSNLSKSQIEIVVEAG